jgi:hypothetical protein
MVVLNFWYFTQVYNTIEGKGWAIRTLEALEAGCLVFEYAGEVVSNSELLRRGDRSKFSLALDADWEFEVADGDDSLLSNDSTEFCNIGKWLNHW